MLGAATDERPLPIRWLRQPTFQSTRVLWVAEIKPKVLGAGSITRIQRDRPRRAYVVISTAPNPEAENALLGGLDTLTAIVGLGSPVLT